MVKTTQEYLELPYPIILTKHRDDMDTYWFAEIPDLPGCCAHGATPNQAIEELQASKELWIDKHIEDGYAVPEPRANLYNEVIKGRRAKQH